MSHAYQDMDAELECRSSHSFCVYFCLQELALHMIYDDYFSVRKTGSLSVNPGLLKDKQNA